MSDVIDNKAASRFELETDGLLSIAEYRIADGAIYFTHTEVPPQLGGRGVGGKLIHAALADARARGLKIVPRCSFVAAYIAKHPEFRT